VNKKGREKMCLLQWQTYQEDDFEVATCHLSYVRSHCSSFPYDPFSIHHISGDCDVIIRRFCKFFTSFVWEFLVAVILLFCGSTAQHRPKPPHC
jgi:hypothetical protein